MTELLDSYTFEAKKIVYYSVTVGAENKTEAKRIAKDLNIVHIMKRLKDVMDMNIRWVKC